MCQDLYMNMYNISMKYWNYLLLKKSLTCSELVLWTSGWALTLLFWAVRRGRSCRGSHALLRLGFVWFTPRSLWPRLDRMNWLWGESCLYSWLSAGAWLSDGWNSVAGVSWVMSHSNKGPEWSPRVLFSNFVSHQIICMYKLWILWL